MMQPMIPPRVLVVVLGGTITMTRSATGGIAPTLSGADLVAAVPGLDSVAALDVRTPFQLPGASLTLAHLAEVAEILTEGFAAGAVGAVVVQGTDTIEETAFVLDCLHAGPQPVVVTGAMRGPEAAGADGPGNLLSAVMVAATPAATGLGAMVVLDDTVHAARFVRKGHTGLTSAFASHPHGPVGHVIEGGFVPQLRPAFRPAPVLPKGPIDAAAVPPVVLVTAGLGDDGQWLGALPALGFAGVVVAAMGAGHVPASWAVPLGALAERMPVVLSTRVGQGPVFTRTYGFPGSERDLLARGLIEAGGLGPVKARLLLQLLLFSGAERDAVVRGFSAFAASVD